MSCRVGIIDHGLSNINSICRAIESSGGEVVIVKSAKALKLADKLVLPGVGAFGSAMHNLHNAELVEPIKLRVLCDKVMILGVCLGMQLLATSSEESKGISGLGLLAGAIKKLSPLCGEAVPHIGWNGVEQRYKHPLFKNIQDGSDFYFVHSYYYDAPDSLTLGKTLFAQGFTSVVGNENVFGVQFHPEKSQKNGLCLLKNFIEL